MKKAISTWHLVEDSKLFKHLAEEANTEEDRKYFSSLAEKLDDLAWHYTCLENEGILK